LFVQAIIDADTNKNNNKFFIFFVFNEVKFNLRFLNSCVSNDTQQQKNLIIKVSKQIIIQINVLFFSKNLHNREVPSSNTGLDTLKSRISIKSWVHCCFCVRFA
jgi:hypothetical protein